MIAVNAFQAVITCIYLTRCFKIKDKLKPDVTYMIMWLLNFLFLQVQTYITVFEGYGGLISVLFITVLCAAFVQADIISCLVQSVIVYMTAAFASMIVAGLILLNSGRTFMGLLTSTGADMVIATVLVQIIWVASLYLIIRVQQSDFGMNNRLYTYAAILIPIISLIVCTMIVYSMNGVETHILYSLVSIIGIILMNVLAFYLLIRLNKSYKNSMEAEIQKKIYESRCDDMRKLQDEHDRLQKLRHEFNSIIRSALYMAKSGSTDELIKYLEEMDIDKELPMPNRLYSDNIMLNYLLNNIESRCAASDIDFSSFIMGKFDGIKDMDVLILFGNLFDNAMDALKVSKKKHLYVEIVCDDVSISIKVTNSVNGNVLLDNKELRTTKPDKLAHGYGIRNIRDVVERHSGTIEYKYMEPDYLKCRIILLKDSFLKEEQDDIKMKGGDGDE